MSRERTGRAALVAVMAITAGLGSALLAGTGANAAPADPLAGKKYVALGDSFAAGFGLVPYATTPDPECFRSTNGIAEQVAAVHQLQLTDVSCTGATIANVAATPQTLIGGGTVPVQLEAVTPDTALVSLMIGGNDLGFSSVLAACAAASPSGPLLLDPASATCAGTYQPQLAAALQSRVAPALEALLAAIRQKAPDATVVLLGYPALSPTDAATPAAGCFSSAIGAGQPPLPQNTFPFTTADRAFIANMSAQLDAAQQAAATKTGALFVSNLAGTDTHTPCAGTTDPWLNGITLQSLTPPSVQPTSMHPAAAGAAYLAKQLSAVFASTVPPQPGDPGEGDAGGPGLPGDPTAPGASTPSPTSSTATGSTVELAATGTDSGPMLLIALSALAAGTALASGRMRRRAS